MNVKTWKCGARLFSITIAMLFSVLSAQAQTDAILQPIGGSGGGPFVARCPQGELLTGFDLWTGDQVDAIRPICIPAVAGQFQIYPLRFGGNGGVGPQQLVCPNDAPIVIAMEVASEYSRIVRHIHLFCGQAVAAPQRTPFPLAVYDGPPDRGEEHCTVLGCNRMDPESGTLRCPAGLVGAGIVGRHGKFLDALGLICGAPPPPPATPPTPVRAQARVKVDPTGAVRPWVICDIARRARARNSPAAPGLEQSCREAGAAGEIAPVKPQGRVKVDPTGAPVSPRAICDRARLARARNSPAAPGLEESCRANLAAKGAAIAQVDPIVAAARTAETDVLYRQGFDIATAFFGDSALGAEGRTATGPGSLGIRDQLTPAGQRGFNDSVKFHLRQDYTRTSLPAAPTITANANPVMVPNGQASGTTTISWKAAPDYTYCEIYLSVNNGEWSEFARGGDGSKTTTIQPGTSQTFRMMVYEGQAGTPKIITTLTVTARN